MQKDGMRTEMKSHESKSFTKQPPGYTEVCTAEWRWGRSLRAPELNIYIYIYIFILKSISEFKVFLFYSIIEVGRKSLIWTNYFPDQKRISPTFNITPIDIFCGQTGQL